MKSKSTLDKIIEELIKEKEAHLERDWKNSALGLHCAIVIVQRHAKKQIKDNRKI